MKTTTTKDILNKAIQNVNKEHGYKLQFNRFDETGKTKKYINFTIKTESKIPGARISHSGRNLPKASWHAHGYLFDEIFKLDPNAVIYSFGDKITKGFDWQDKNVGSQMRPVYFSELSIL